MRVRLIALFAAVFLVVGNVGGTGWVVVASYPAPAPNARGICVGDVPYGTSILCDGSPPRVYDLFRASEYITLAVPQGAWGLVSGESDTIWVSNYNNSYIYKLTSTGSVLSSFRCPKAHPADLSRWALYAAIPDENLAIEITTTGSILSSFRGPGTRLTAIDACNITEAVLGDPATHKVYFSGYGTGYLDAPVAVCADRLADGPPYVHILVVDSTTNYVYLFKWVGSEAVAPASFGRVKALFK